MRHLAAFVVGGIAAGSAWSGVAQPTDAPTFGHHHWGGHWHGWFAGPVTTIFFLLIVVLAAVLMVRWVGGHGPGGHASHHAPRGKTPLDILKERFAKGEIDKEEYEERRRVLGE